MKQTYRLTGSTSIPGIPSSDYQAGQEVDVEEDDTTGIKTILATRPLTPPVMNTTPPPQEKLIDVGKAKKEITSA